MIFLFDRPKDGAGDSLRPRLEAAGGNASHVRLLSTVVSLDAKKRQVVDRPFSLAHDLQLLEAAIQRTHALLVILDPLMAVLGHNNEQRYRTGVGALIHYALNSLCGPNQGVINERPYMWLLALRVPSSKM